jgi:hypothetical protein
MSNVTLIITKALYYQSQLPQVFDMLQTLDIRRIDNLKGFIVDTVRLDLEVSPRIDRCHNQVLIAAGQVQAEKDTEKIVYMYKTGLPIPEDYQYVELTAETSSTNKMSRFNSA